MATKIYRAKSDLFIGWARAHGEGSEFVSTPEQIEANGWKDDVEGVKASDAQPAATAPEASTR